jgi:hypothetical protein
MNVSNVFAVVDALPPALVASLFALYGKDPSVVSDGVAVEEKRMPILTFVVKHEATLSQIAGLLSNETTLSAVVTAVKAAAPVSEPASA